MKKSRIKLNIYFYDILNSCSVRILVDTSKALYKTPANIYIQTRAAVTHYDVLLIVSLFPRGGRGGADSSMKMPRCVCWWSENIPILKDVLGKK